MRYFWVIQLLQVDKEVKEKTVNKDHGWSFQQYVDLKKNIGKESRIWLSYLKKR